MRRIAPPATPLTRAGNAHTGLTEVPTPSSHPSRSPSRPAPIPAADDLQCSERCPRASQGGRAAAPALTSGKRPKPGNPAGTATPLPPCPYRGERLSAASPTHFCTSSRPRSRAGTGLQDKADPRGTPRLSQALVQTEAARLRQRGAMTFGGCAGSCPTTESRGLRPSAFPPGAGRFARRSCHGAGLAFSPRPPPQPPPASGVAEAHSSVRGRPLQRVPAGCGAGCGSGGSLSFAAGAMAAGKPQSLPGPGGPREPWRLPAEGRPAPGRYLR